MLWKWVVRNQSVNIPIKYLGEWLIIEPIMRVCKNGDESFGSVKAVNIVTN
jgi:hypothetical protein